MISKAPTKRASTLCLTLGAILLVSGCSSQPSLGPKATATALPGHIDGGSGQLLRFCETLHDKGELATAAAMCERAHRLDPSRPEPLLELASILGEMGEPELAVKAYRTVLQNTPDNAAAHYGLGRHHLDRGAYEAALGAFERAAQADPANPRLHSALGVAHGLLGQHVQAQDAFRKGLRFAPEDRALRNNLALSLVQTGRYDQGVTLLSTLAGEPDADRASRENLQMAQGLAEAARAEALRAEARAKAAAEAKASAEAAAKAEAEAMAKAKTEAEAAPPAAAVPDILVSYPESAWPMDGPGEDGAVPISSPGTQMASRSAAEAGAPTRLTPERLAESGKPLRPSPKPLTRPTPLTKPTPLTGGMTSRAETRPELGPEPGPELLPRSEPASPANARQTAHAEPGHASDADPSAFETGEAIAWWPAPEAASQRPRRLPGYIPGQSASRPLDPTPFQTPAPLPAETPIESHLHEPAPLPATSGDYAVQFASYTSEERAWRGWDSLQGAANEILSVIKPEVQRADLGADIGVVYRLRSAPTPKAVADRVCETLKARGVDCLVMQAETAASGTAETL